RFAQMVRAPLEQVIGAPIASFVAANYRTTLETLIEQACTGHCTGMVRLIRAGGTAVWVELSMSPAPMESSVAICLIATDITERIRKDGQRVCVSLTLSPLRDGEGRVQGASAVARDITEAKRAERALRDFNENLERLVTERTAELRAILDAAPSPIWIAHDAE